MWRCSSRREIWTQTSCDLRSLWKGVTTTPVRDTFFLGIRVEVYVASVTMIFLDAPLSHITYQKKSCPFSKSPGFSCERDVMFLKKIPRDFLFSYNLPHFQSPFLKNLPNQNWSSANKWNCLTKQISRQTNKSEFIGILLQSNMKIPMYC